METARNPYLYYFPGLALANILKGMQHIYIRTCKRYATKEPFSQLSTIQATIKRDEMSGWIIFRKDFHKTRILRSSQLIWCKSRWNLILQMLQTCFRPETSLSNPSLITPSVATISITQVAWARQFPKATTNTRREYWSSSTHSPYSERKRQRREGGRTENAAGWNEWHLDKWRYRRDGSCWIACTKLLLGFARKLSWFPTSRRLQRLVPADGESVVQSSSS